MNIEIIKEKEVPLLERKRIVLKYASQEGKTPARKTIAKEVAKMIKVKDDQVAIRHIYSQFGVTSSKIIAHVYKDFAAMEKYEDENTLVKQGLKEAKPKNKAAPAKK